MPEEQAQSHPHIYAIEVAGRIDPERSAWFGNLAVRVEDAADGSVSTTLSGPLSDQAALFGVLSRIRDMGLSLLSVRQLSPGESPAHDHLPNDR
ncbi:MAG: hypothetical protein H3C34_25755 [Caldilineaceae bacterium]|nr:hypothetical protein [Caldilineaceae bacterium]